MPTSVIVKGLQAASLRLQQLAGPDRSTGAVPPLLSPPLLWASRNLDQLNQGISSELVMLTCRSLGLALAAAALAVIAALVLSIAKRWSQARWLRGLTFLAGMGYAIPGAVLALALQLLGGPWQLAPLLLLLWGYCDRLLARRGMESARTLVTEP